MYMYMYMYTYIYISVYLSAYDDYGGLYIPRETEPIKFMGNVFHNPQWVPETMDTTEWVDTGFIMFLRMVHDLNLLNCLFLEFSVYSFQLKLTDGN